MMYVSVFTPEDRMWSVGFYDPQGKFRSMRDFDSDQEAAAFINYLCGGDGRNFDDAKEVVGAPPNVLAIVTINRVVQMLNEAMQGGAGSRDTIERAIKNLEALGMNFLQEKTVVV